MAAEIRGLIFDLDGTLCDTIPVCIASFQAAFALNVGQNFSEADIRALFGPDEAGIIRQVVPAAWEACLADYLIAYESEHDACSAAFDGIVPLLARLRNRGLLLAIVTGKGQGSCAISLRRLGLGEYFDVVETGSNAGPVKPQRIRAVLDRWDLPAAEAAYVGDSPFDVRDARETGVRAMAAGWAASTDVAGLRAERPDALFTTVAEFAEWIDQHVARL
jgi:phosphoglycolate phosphatase-like HAD superfamily hydrolase